MQGAINGKTTAEEDRTDNNTIKGDKLISYQLFMIFSQDIPAEKDKAIPGRYNKWRGLLGVMVLIVAVLYPFKMFFE